jgi:chemotaxis signal transduction protein
MTSLMKAVAALSRTFKLPQTDTRSGRTQDLRWRGLRIGNLALLVPHDSGGELLEEVRLCALPHTQRWCRGLINLRGRLIPVFDLHEYFGLTRQRAQKQWWLVLGGGDDALAFPIDALPQTLTSTATAQVQPAALPDALRAFVSIAYRIDGALWLKFDHREFFRSLTPQAAA